MLRPRSERIDKDTKKKLIFRPRSTKMTPFYPLSHTAQSTAFLLLFYACFTVVLRFLLKKYRKTIEEIP
jgi:hypothetical protein